MERRIAVVDTKTGLRSHWLNGMKVFLGHLEHHYLLKDQGKNYTKKKIGPRTQIDILCEVVSFRISGHKWEKGTKFVGLLQFLTIADHIQLYVDGLEIYKFCMSDAITEII